MTWLGGTACEHTQVGYDCMKGWGGGRRARGPGQGGCARLPLVFACFLVWRNQTGSSGHLLARTVGPAGLGGIRALGMSAYRPSQPL